jgi:hypothetical protein
MSDNTNLHTWLWTQGVVSFYGGWALPPVLGHGG